MKAITKMGMALMLNFLMLTLFTQQAKASDIEMADLMRSNGMIYVVILVLSIVFAGIIVFLFLIEKRLKKLEKQKD